jgi:hypothetical protein
MWWQEEELLSLDPGDTDMTEGLKEATANDARQMVDALAEMGALGVNGVSLVSTPLGRWAAVELLREDGFDPPTEPESPAPTARDRPSTWPQHARSLPGGVSAEVPIAAQAIDASIAGDSRSPLAHRTAFPML